MCIIKIEFILNGNILFKICIVWFVNGNLIFKVINERWINVSRNDVLFYCNLRSLWCWFYYW